MCVSVCPSIYLTVWVECVSVSPSLFAISTLSTYPQADLLIGCNLKIERKTVHAAAGREDAPENETTTKTGKTWFYWQAGQVNRQVRVFYWEGSERRECRLHGHWLYLVILPLFHSINAFLLSIAQNFIGYGPLTSGTHTLLDATLATLNFVLFNIKLSMITGDANTGKEVKRNEGHGDAECICLCDWECHSLPSSCGVKPMEREASCPRQCLRR